MADEISRNLAANIAQIREVRGFTQEQLAKLSGIPRPTLANLESGEANPTLVVLAKVANALQISIQEIIGSPREACRFYSANELSLKRRGEAVIKGLVPDAPPGMEVDRLELPAGVRMGGIPHRRGTREYLSCESGKIELTVAGEKWLLNTGDVIAFRGDQKHSYANPGKIPAIGFSLVFLAPLPL